MNPSDSTHGGGFPGTGSDAGPPANGNVGGEDSTKVQMKKQLGLLEGVAIILGIIFGSGESVVLFLFKCVRSSWFLCMRLCEILMKYRAALLNVCVCVPPPVFSCRHFCVAERRHTGGERGGHVAGRVGPVRPAVDDRRSVLRRAGYLDTAVWRRLCVYPRGVRLVAGLSLSVGRNVHICVSTHICTGLSKQKHVYTERRQEHKKAQTRIHVSLYCNYDRA